MTGDQESEQQHINKWHFTAVIYSYSYDSVKRVSVVLKIALKTPSYYQFLRQIGKTLQN